jgi:4-alpha-glucanotransferase
VLLHVTSLPSSHGIGDLGPAAFTWVDRLHEARQGWWQALPLGPTAYGDSPYQCLSSFAGNELLISADGLIADDLVQAGDCADRSFSATAVDEHTGLMSRELESGPRHVSCRPLKVDLHRQHSSRASNTHSIGRRSYRSSAL